MMTIKNEHFNSMKMVSCNVTTLNMTTIENMGCRGVWGHYGIDRGVGDVRVYWGLLGGVGAILEVSGASGV